MKARIFKPTKTAMQSGKAKTKMWTLEFEHNGHSHIEPLMGWISSSDTNREVVMHFSTKESAIKFAIINNIDYEVFEPNIQKSTKQSYADKFL